MINIFCLLWKGSVNFKGLPYLVVESSLSHWFQRLPGCEGGHVVSGTDEMVNS